MIATRMLSNSIKAILVTACFATPAWAQSVSAPTTQTVNEVCAVAPPFDDATMRTYLERVLTPGPQVTPTAIPPETMAKLMALQKEAIARQAKDWADLCRYAADNANVRDGRNPPRAVFLGDSITEFWRQGDPAFFAGTVQNRGISGQTTAQMVLRFYPDVVALKPRVVHIMAGTNDVGGNLGPVSDDTIVANISAMLDMARANRIAVVLASIPPARLMSWRPGLTPAPRIVALNLRLKQLAEARGAVFVDYHAQLRDDQGGFLAALANDGVHPNRDGYALMRPLAERAIAQALRMRN